MSRITEEIAKEIAEKLTEKKKEEIKKTELELRSKLEDFIYLKLPKDVVDLFKKQPNYFNTKSCFRVSGFGLNYEYLYTNNEVPYVNNNSFEPSEEQAKILLKLNNKVTDLKKKKSELFRNIENVLYSLRTYTKVIAEFPEAEPFLPKTITNKLSLNVSDIRQQLK